MGFCNFARSGVFSWHPTIITMKTSSFIITGLALSATAAAILINAELALALFAAAGMLTIAVNDYASRRATISGLAV